ncbi:MAG: MBL fold hydrolase [Chlamydiales bacterium 38-26]|nr:MBL fold metallo-hydrolase [Chlamydiales bacterium]OJV10892.1 MAG: MBL fold hydrolase [Chlamydiales bacterium 38-26]
MKSWIVEGNRQHLDGGAMFGNAPKALWSRWVKVDAHNRIPLACRTLLIQTDSGQNILFEAGIGNFFEPKMKERYGIYEQEHTLLKNLEKIGFKPSDIDVVVLSHLHFDHAGGLLSSYGEEPHLVFPNAIIYVSQEHWGRAQKPHIREQASFIPLLHQLLLQSGRLKFIEEQTHPDMDFVRFHYSHGHTVGQMISEIEMQEGPVFFVGDLVPGIPWLHLPVTMGYDRFPELIVDEKTRLLEFILKNKGRLFFTHDPDHALIVLSCDDKGRYDADLSADLKT